MKIFGLCLLACILLPACSSLAPNESRSAGTTPETPPVEGDFIKMLDDFEGSFTSWNAGLPPDYLDSSAQGVKVSSANAASGSQSLEMVFEKNESPKAIFYLERQIDLSVGKFLEFELYNPGSADGAGLAVSTGSSWEWYESEVVSLTEGENRLSFDLQAANYKSASTGWQPSTVISSLEKTQRIAVLIIPRQAGSVYLDNLRISATPNGNLPEVSSVPATPKPEPKTASKVELRTLSDRFRAYERAEFEVLTDGVYANPFDPGEVDLQVEFTSPVGITSLVPAFWSQDYNTSTQLPIGEAGWRVRFTPRQAGEWTAQGFYQSVLRSDSEPIQSEPLLFVVEDNLEVHGFVRRHPTNPAYLAFENGETFFPVGINIGWGSSDPLQDYKHWLDRLSANGGNLIRVWMASWSFGIEWNDTGLGDYSNRLQRAWLLDQVFQMAEARGVYIELVLLNHGAFSATVNPEWDNNPYNAANGGPCEQPEDFAVDEKARDFFKRRLRYTAGRWAYSPALVAWEWWNEADWTPISNSQMRDWIEEMTPHLQSFDPYDHLISTSYARGSNSEINGMEEIDFSQLHLYSPLDPMLDFPDLYEDWNSELPGKPVLFAEYGASAGGEDLRSDDRQGLHLHNALWASTFSGYASTAMYWWWDSYVDPLGLWEVFGRLDRFLAGEDLATLYSAKGVLSSREVPYLVRMNDQRALVWLHDRAYELGALQRARAMAILQGKKLPEDWVYLPEPVTGLTLKLSGLKNGDYRVYWYSPNQGEWTNEEPIQVNDNEVILTLPDFGGDLALKVISVDEINGREP